MSILGGQTAGLLELDPGNHAGLHIADLHDPCVLNVDLAHDQVVDGRCHLQTKNLYAEDHSNSLVCTYVGI